jgi:hypothetical protein
MELASMLAGERFSDHPKSVSRVIAAFLRAYNDAVDDARRQDLYRCAAQVVGTRDSRASECARLARCERELADLQPRARPKAGRWITHALHALDPSSNISGRFDHLATRLCISDDGHRRALALVDELVGIQIPQAPPCRPMTGEPDSTSRAGRHMHGPAGSSPATTPIRTTPTSCA